ncbi:bifunctional proline dehydrogenase/L-glutamate gamma-semialdehyde dehydrogenase [Agrococcus carbonis]|uniref:L-glutamate gamma-semialdehyde dehydrogenase n=1 Tax=Agrococcus carbonis TaxID=684552 RepID=A0A1H1R302_9MICO|nr:bifunctional proline dehydrogenase/L-glutamate gamma-semialdehyde dehydrogenase [Agrococcus carbonis]SDS30000.1 L-proline dehydrogenase /delta-1-pyrroline-5-carboxylate dehydrogenase [Agrococcus carbonis]
MGASATAKQAATKAAGSTAEHDAGEQSAAQQAVADAAARAATQHAVDPAELEALRALAPEVVAQVRTWLEQAERIPADSSAEQLAGVLRDPKGLDFAVRFVDGVVRPEDVHVAARTLREIAGDAPSFLPWPMRQALKLGGGVAPLAPQVVVPIARRVLREMVGHLIIDATDARLGAAIKRIRATGARLNVNLLGEYVLGAREAERRIEGTRALIERPDVDYASIKVSATTAPHQPWAFDSHVEHVVERLLPLYRRAAENGTFINLDMEEYKDLEMTMAVFTRILETPGLERYRGGIVLQAYLPDALPAMQRLQAWAAARVAGGGAPVKVRLVKGANLPMERVEASIHDWPLATWHSKQDSDTHYKRVLTWALTTDRIANVELGVAGHNLFDVAFAWLLAKQRGIEAGLDFEMLLGMAQGQAEVVRRDVGGLLLYTPVVHPAEFDVAIAYLIRRLEEGASRENFMSAVFELATDEGLFERERDRFLASLDALAAEAPATHRVQDRTQAPEPMPTTGFRNAPDTDPSLPANQAWAAGIRERAKTSRLGFDAVEASLVRDAEALEAVITTGLAANDAWRALSGDERAAILHRVGDELEARRAELMEVAASEAGKTLDQSDPEVSEAIDFAHFYAERARHLDTIDGAVAVPSRLIAVTPPWNFPIAIPAGSTLAALASGASVIIKPARATARTGSVMVEALWAAGVPKDVLQLVQLGDRSLGDALVGDERVDRVILTGGFETAEAFRRIRPDLNLLAETSGKNAIIVMPSADYDLAAKDIVASAFGHAGQKCSAASLAVLVGQAGRSKRLHNQIVDGVRSLETGWPWDADSQMGPVIAPAEGKLLDGLTRLGEGEAWVVEPKQLDDEGKLWSPGLRAGVQRGSEYHLTEYFGPILGIMRVETLEEAIAVVNEVDYGLTSGLHSLEPDEIGQWLDTIQAGNLYVNRGITGAIVERQPFGGWKRSVVGPTTKAGGPSYLLPLVDWVTAEARELDPIALPSVQALVDAVDSLARSSDASVSAGEADALRRSAGSDQHVWATELGVARDVQGLLAERDILRHLPMPGVVIRLAEGGRIAQLARAVVAALRAGAEVRVSTAIEPAPAVRAALAAAGVPVEVHDDAAFAAAAARLPQGRIRYLAPEATVAAGVRALAEAVDGRPDLAIVSHPVTEAGRVELLPFLREQAIAITAHRFGTPNHLTDRLI